MEPDLSQFATDPLAIPVLSLMREGRWRKARDAAKDLCKRDRGRYLTLLIEANVGLVRELLGKGLAKDATTVVAYLETIAPPALVAGLRAELANPVTKPPTPEPGHADRALGWAAVLRADAAVRAGTALTPADLAEIDLLVADTYLPPAALDDEAVLEVLKQLAAVRAACEATGDGKWDRAQELLREVPAQSVFRHWRMFLRGVRCFFQDQPDPARQCFAGLPPDGALARAARALAPSWVPPGPLAPATARVPLALAMTAQPAAWASPILAAATAWKAGKRVKAFEELQAGMKGVFPANQPGLPALLTTALVPFRERMNDQDSDDIDQLTARYDVWDERRIRSAPDSALALLRPMVLAEWASMGPGQFESSWGTVIEVWNRSDGPNPLRDSLAWQWLGESLLKLTRNLGPFGPPADLKRARKALDKAVECDPANQAAWLALLGLLEQQGDSKTRNRLLDDLAKRFPNNKAILAEAGRQAVERKAFDKGLVALRAALALDPLDREIKSQIAIALVLQIRDHGRKNRSAAPLWAQLEPLLEDRASRDHFMLSRWMARVRRALLDFDPQAAQAAFDDAVRLAPSDLERLFLEKAFASVYGVKQRKGWPQEWQAAKQGGGLKWATLLGIFEIHSFVANIKEWDRLHSRQAVKLSLELCAILVADDFELDPDGTLAYIDHLDILAKEPNPLVETASAACLKLFLDSLRKATDSKKKSPDLRLQLAVFVLEERQAGPRFTASEKFFKALATLVAEAEAAGMAGVVSRAHALRTRWEQRAAREEARRNNPEADFDEDWDEDDEDWVDDDDDWDDEDEDYDEDEEADAAMEELVGLMIDLEVAVLAGNQKTLDAALKKLREFGMPEPVIAETLAKIKAKGTLMPKPPKPKAKPKAKPAKPVKPAPPAKPVPAPKPPKPPPAVDPNQLDLF